MMETRVKKKIERLRYLLSLEKNEEDSFFKKQFKDFSLLKIEKAAKQGICWYPLIFSHTNIEKEEKINVTFHLPDEIESEHSFQPGNAIKIFKADISTGAIVRMTEGVIELILDKKVEISYIAKKPILWLETETGIGIHLTFSKYTFSVMEKALDDIQQADDNRLAQLRDIMLGNQIATFQYNTSYQSEWLNQSQQMAVNNILASHDIAIVHGPPGTGKTTTLVEAIIETLKTERQVMVCAYNNIAVDVIAEKLMERDINVVRIGNPAKVTDELLNVTYESKYFEHPYYADILSCKTTIQNLQSEYAYTSRNRQKKKELRREINNYRYYAELMALRIKTAIFDENRVVAATMIGSVNKILRDISFSTVFIDEAAQALEPACWVPITKAHRVIFAGDHKQLPPTIKSYEAARTGLMFTLFEKIIAKKPEYSTMLLTQYRMHESIMKFSSQWFYKGRLKASETIRIKKLIDNDIPVEWIDTSLCKFNENRQDSGTSIYNFEEVEIVMQTLFAYIEKLDPSRIMNDKISFGIISPYAAQVDLFRKKIYNDGFLKQLMLRKLIIVKTIDGFQGQERDVIIISLVRSNKHSQIGFLADYRRINVAITRAKKKLFLIGDSSTLSGDPFFEALYLYVRKSGLVTEILPETGNRYRTFGGRLLNTLYSFINEHSEDDLAELLLSAKRYPAIDVPFAVDQIRARRAIREKLPTWFVNTSLLFPSKMAVEQCSSEQTARYKLRLLRDEKSLCDLTGGLGVDMYFFARSVPQVIYVERSSECFDIAMHNFSQLQIHNITGYNDNAENVLKKMQSVDIIYIDPARRDKSNRRFVALSDCEPDLQKILPLMLSKAQKVIAKLSPMLDIKHTLRLLPETTEIHVVSVRNECKELLFVCQNYVNIPLRRGQGEVYIHCINYTTEGVEQSFRFMLSTEQTGQCVISNSVQTYLYEPNTSILKAGGYKQIAILTGVEKLHKNTHLYTSEKLLTDFPGRIFQVLEVFQFSGKLCKQIHKTIPQAHIAIRNFPVQVSELRQRTRVTDGGDCYLFATTLADEKKVIIQCRKVKVSS